MYIYNTLPIELLDSIVAQTQPSYNDSIWEIDYLVITKSATGEYGYFSCDKYESINILEIPYIVGIKYIGGQPYVVNQTYAPLVH